MMPKSCLSTVSTAFAAALIAALALPAATTRALTTPAAATQSAAQAGPPAINLPLEGWTVVAQDKGILKEEFDKIGTTEIRLLDPGTTQMSGAEAALLDRGGLAFAQRMMYPAAVHRANGLDAVIIWQSVASDEYRLPVLALKDSSYSSVKDLAGLALGSSRVGCGWTSPVEILDTAGVPLSTRIRQGSVRHETIENSATVNAALLSGRIAATATHIAIPAAAALYTSGQVKVIGRSPTNGVYVNDAGRVSYFAMRDFADKYPAAVHAFLVARLRAIDWIKNNVDDASEIVAKELRLPLNIARFTITDRSAFAFMDGEPSADVAVESVKIFQKYYIDHGDDILIDHHLSDEQIEALIDRRFFAGGEYSIY